MFINRIAQSQNQNTLYQDIEKECDKFLESRGIVGLLGVVPLCHHAFVGNQLVRNFSSWCFVGQIYYRGFAFFSSGNFVVQKLFLVGFLWVQNVFLWVFRGSKIFACGLLVDPFFSVANFANRKFSAIGCMIKSAHFNNCQPCLYQKDNSISSAISQFSFVLIVFL